MQFLVISQQLSGMLVAFILGAFLGLVYDLLRAVRHLLSFTKGEVLIANVLDVLFSVFAGISFCILLYSVSHGRYRWFNAVSVVLGFILYRRFPGRIIKPFLFYLIDKIQKIIGFILLPLKRIIKYLLDGFRLLSDRCKYLRLKKQTDKFENELCDIAKFK